MAKLGVLPPVSDMFGPGGQALLDEMDFEGGYGLRVESLRDLMEIYDRELADGGAGVCIRLARHRAIRPSRPSTGWAGHRRHLRGRDRRRQPFPRRPAPVLLGRGDAAAPGVRHQGPPGPDHQAREQPGALGGHRGGGPLPRRGAHRPGVHRIAERRGENIARVAAARKLLSLVYYGLRDGEIRCLAQEAG